MRKYITSSILPVAFSCFGVEKAYMEGSKTNSKLHPPSFSATNTTSNPKTFKKPVPVTLDTLVLLSGSSHRELTKKISDTIHVPICNATISRYSDGEASVQIYDNIRGKDVFIVQPCAAPVNDSIMELLLSVSCAKRANARRVVAVIPYFGYKHHRRGNSLSTKHSSRFLSSGAADFALMLEELGVDRVIVLDLQRPGQGLEACFFDNSVPVENVFSHDILISHLAKKLNFEEPITIVAPNAECYKKASKFQNELQKLTTQKVSLVCFISSDTGSGPTDPNKLTVVSDPNTKFQGDVVLVDDMIDSGYTLGVLSHRIKLEGAKRIFYCAAHGLFTGDAMETIDQCDVDSVIVTDSLPLPKDCSKKIEQVSIANYLSDVILTEHFRTINAQEEIYEAEEN